MIYMGRATVIYGGTGGNDLCETGNRDLWGTGGNDLWGTATVIYGGRRP